MSGLGAASTDEGAEAPSAGGFSACDINMNYPTWKKYVVLANCIESLRVRDKRVIFQLMRANHCRVTQDSFLPHFGFTMGEFSTWYVLNDTSRKYESKRRPRGGAARQQG